MLLSWWPPIYYWDRYLNFPAHSQRNKLVIITSKRRFDVIIACLLRFVFAGNFTLCNSCNPRFVMRIWTETEIWFSYINSTLALQMTNHYCDVKMGAMASQITSLTIAYTTVYSGTDQRKHQSSASLAFVWGIHQWREFPAQMASNAENVSIWWRHHSSRMKIPSVLIILKIDPTGDQNISHAKGIFIYLPNIHIQNKVHKFKAIYLVLRSSIVNVPILEAIRSLLDKE